MKFLTRFRPANALAFSLVELLAVLAITVVLATVSAPSISALSGAGDVNKAASDFAQTLEMARSYAMSRQTYVRVAIADVAPGGAIPEGGTVILSISASDGTLTADTASDMADTGKWPSFGRPLVLRNFQVLDTLATTVPDTSADLTPSSSDIVTTAQPLNRQVTGVGNLGFQTMVQFGPDGQAFVKKKMPARQIKIGLDKRGAQGKRNPFLLRLSGNNGRVHILRKEDGLQ